MADDDNEKYHAFDSYTPEQRKAVLLNMDRFSSTVNRFDPNTFISAYKIHGFDKANSLFGDYYKAYTSADKDSLNSTWSNLFSDPDSPYNKYDIKPVGNSKDQLRQSQQDQINALGPEGAANFVKESNIYDRFMKKGVDYTKDDAAQDYQKDLDVVNTVGKQTEDRPGSEYEFVREGATPQEVFSTAESLKTQAGADAPFEKSFKEETNRHVEDMKKQGFIQDADEDEDEDEDDDENTELPEDTRTESQKIQDYYKQMNSVPNVKAGYDQKAVRDYENERYKEMQERRQRAVEWADKVIENASKNFTYDTVDRYGKVIKTQDPVFLLNSAGNEVQSLWSSLLHTTGISDATDYLRDSDNGLARFAGTFIGGLTQMPGAFIGGIPKHIAEVEEAIEGRDLATGEELSLEQRGFSFVHGAIDLATDYFMGSGTAAKLFEKIGLEGAKRMGASFITDALAYPAMQNISEGFHELATRPTDSQLQELLDSTKAKFEAVGYSPEKNPIYEEQKRLHDKPWYDSFTEPYKFFAGKEIDPETGEEIGPDIGENARSRFLEGLPYGFMGLFHGAKHSSVEATKKKGGK